METALRHMLADGTLRLNESLPTQRQLAEAYSVSRDTVQRALAKLVEEGWIASRPGSRMWVIRIPATTRAEERSVARGKVALGPLIHRAFEQTQVSLDVFSLTGETFVRHLKNQEERVLAQEIAPQQLRIRLLLPGEQSPLIYPRALDPGDLRVWERWRDMLRGHVAELSELADRLQGAGVDSRIEVRRFPSTPQFKLYVLNESEMLFNPYEPVERTIMVKDAERPVAALDVLGLGSAYSYHRLDDDDEYCHDSLFFTNMIEWFNANWEIWPTMRLRTDHNGTERPR
ncbi:GntR family transcriptional regulator [Streptomyces sp. NPDC002144]